MFTMIRLSGDFTIITISMVRFVNDSFGANETHITVTNVIPSLIVY